MHNFISQFDLNMLVPQMIMVNVKLNKFMRRQNLMILSDGNTAHPKIYIVHRVRDLLCLNITHTLPRFASISLKQLHHLAQQMVNLWTPVGYIYQLSPGDHFTHDDVIKWEHFPRYWPFVRGIHRSPVYSPSQRPVTRSFDVFFDLCP